MTNLTDIEQEFINRLDRWKIKIKQMVEANEEASTVVIAMSRKMPHLLDYLKRTEGFVLDNCEVATEHSIPFIFADRTRKFRVIIIDDILVYGGTIEKTAKEIYSYTGIKPFVLPIIVGSKVKSKLEFVEKLSEEDIYTDTVSFCELPLYSSYISDLIFKEGGPIDMVFPILRFPAKRHMVIGLGDSGNKCIKHLKERLEDSITEEFEKENIYKLTYTNSQKNRNSDGVYSISCLYNESKLKTQDNEFCKLRLFFTSEECRFTIYAPSIISQRDLNDSTFFKEYDWHPLWKEISDIILKKDNEEFSCAGFSYLNQIYLLKKLRRYHSLALLANYMLALNYVPDILKITQTIWPQHNNLGDLISLHDLQWLFGTHVSNIIHDYMSNIELFTLNTNKLYNRITDSFRIKQRLIPSELYDNYLRLNINRTRLCDTVEEALSLIFTNQHFNVGLASLSSDPDKSSREPFGETYSSLFSSLERFSKDRHKFELSIHKWMDERIDRGIVIPKYENVTDSEGNDYWRRFFRAGENEELLIKCARIASYLLKKITTSEDEIFVKEIGFLKKKKFVTVKEYEDLLYVYFSFLCKENRFPVRLVLEGKQGGRGKTLFLKGSDVKFIDYLDIIKAVSLSRYKDTILVEESNYEIADTLSQTVILNNLESEVLESLCTYWNQSPPLRTSLRAFFFPVHYNRMEMFIEDTAKAIHGLTLSSLTEFPDKIKNSLRDRTELFYKLLSVGVFDWPSHYMKMGRLRTHSQHILNKYIFKKNGVDGKDSKINQMIPLFNLLRLIERHFRLDLEQAQQSKRDIVKRLAKGHSRYISEDVSDKEILELTAEAFDSEKFH